MTLQELKKLIQDKYLHHGKTKPCWCKVFNIGGEWDTPSMSRRCMCEHLKTEHSNKKCEGIITEQYTLSSGAKSNSYFDIKGLMGDSSDSGILILELVEYVDNNISSSIGSLGGTELGGAILAAMFPYSKNTCFIRKQQRIHGMKKMIEGAPNSPILLVDDVISSGKTVIDAARLCRESGYELAGALCVINRYGKDVIPISAGYLSVIFSLFKESDFK